jgi:hypothetical protein
MPDRIGQFDEPVRGCSRNRQSAGKDLPEDKSGRRPVYGETARFQTDPHWKDYILFYEYFHGDNGAGLGASHQTGWTDLVAKLIEIFETLGAATVLQGGKLGVFAELEKMKPAA